MATLTKSNCTVSQSDKGNLYISHPDFKVNLRFLTDVKELQKDPEWRKRISIREGEYGHYAILATTPLTQLDV